MVNITTIDRHVLSIGLRTFIQVTIKPVTFLYVINLYALVLLTGTEQGPESEFKTWSCRW